MVTFIFKGPFPRHSCMVDDVLSGRIDEVSDRLSRAEVRSLLLEAGWPEDVVREYLASVPERREGIILQAHGISKSFGGRPVVNTVDFDVRAGEVFGIIGMSGAGKTTLLNLLAGHVFPDKGDVFFYRGSDALSVIHSPVKRFFGFSSQSPSIYSKLTVLENLEHFGALYGLSGRKLNKRCRELLKLVDLYDSRDVFAGNLSGGMQKRLDIACAMINDPDILFLDEPTADLDPLLRRQLWNLVRDINSRGTTIIVASHFLAEMESMCSRIAVLAGHRVVEVGSADELRKVYSRKFEILFESASHDYSGLKKELSGYDPKVEDSMLHLSSAYPDIVLPVLAKHLKHDSLKSLRIERPSLGKVFEVLVKK